MSETPDAPRSARDDRTQTHDSAVDSGERIGSYRLLTVLGQGGMGQVWLAEQAEMRTADIDIRSDVYSLGVVAMYEARGKPREAAEWRARLPK